MQAINITRIKSELFAFFQWLRLEIRVTIALVQLINQLVDSFVDYFDRQLSHGF